MEGDELRVLYQPQVDLLTDEIVAVQNNINTSFANIIDQSGLDYRVIMLSKHGRATNDQSICISSPLSGNGTCSTPAS